MNAIIVTYNLLGTGPGAFVYHFLILLALEAVAGIAFTEYRRTRNPDQYRLLVAFSILFLLRVPLLAGSLLGASITAPLLYALEVVSLALLGWAFLAPLIGRRAGRWFLTANLLTVAAVLALFFPLWQRMLSAAPFFEYIAFWQQPLWDLWATLLALTTAVVLLTRQRQTVHLFPAVAFLLLTLGNGLILADQLGLGRLVNLLGYPLLALAVYRAALQDLWAAREELERLSEGSLRQTQELLFTVEVSRALGETLDLNAVLQQVVEAVAHALHADQSAIFLSEDDETLQLAARYTPLPARARPEESPRVAVDAQPALAYAVQRRRQLLLKPETATPQLRSLYALLGSQKVGPLLIQPLIRQRRVLGVLVVGNDHSGRSFEEREARLCHSIAAQVSAAIDNARLYRRLEEQARRLADALTRTEEAVGLREAILESIVEGVIVTDNKGHAVLLNDTAANILGARKEQLLGRPLQRLLEPTAWGQPADMSRLMESPTPLQTLLELEGKRIHVSAAPVHVSSGERVGTVAVLRDVTGEMQAEQAKREFIATISHELRTPLTAILGYAEALHSGMAGELTETQKRLVRTIHENARRMTAMANNLIALAEAERGRLELEYRETDLPLIIGETLQAFIPQMKARQLTWELEIEDGFPPIEADPERIRQVVANLLSNAVKFTPPGGHITIGTAIVREKGITDPHFCRLWVADTGIGIPVEEQHRIWERFYSAEEPLKTEAGGLGVGLAIVKSLVEAHHGRVWVDSAPGEGSTFTLLLPIRRPPAPFTTGEPDYPDMEAATGAG